MKASRSEMMLNKVALRMLLINIPAVILLLDPPLDTTCGENRHWQSYCGRHSSAEF